MKIIALEEHFQNAAIEEAVGRLLPAHQRDSAGKFLAESINSTTVLATWDIRSENKPLSQTLCLLYLADLQAD
jgi:hypothetical protein